MASSGAGGSEQDALLNPNATMYTDSSSASELADPYRKHRPGYEFRRSRMASSGYSYLSGHGTFLGTQMQVDQHHETDRPPRDNAVTVALNKCKKKVLLPYQWLLSLVGWRPIVYNREGSCCISFLNTIYFLLVVTVILFGYVVQYAACYRRDRSVAPAKTTTTATPPNLNITTTAVYRETTSQDYVITDCEHHMISQYIIPDVLHSAAYIYALYIIRVSQVEDLEMFMETVFLQSSSSHTAGHLSQRKLVRRLRSFLYLAFMWIVLSFAGQIMHVIAQYDEMSFRFLNQGNSEANKIFLIVLMLFSIMVLDSVYITVVINYVVQCELLIFLMRGLREKVKEKIVKLQQAMKEISDAQKNLKVLNENMASAVSLLMFNFVTMAVLGFMAFIDSENNNFTALMYVSTGMALVLWICIMAMPLTQAARLSGACNALRKLGHEIRVRPFGYQDASQEDLDSFLLFTSSLNMRSKIFRVPIQSSYIFVSIVIVCFTFLLLFQMGVISVWL